MVSMRKVLSLATCLSVPPLRVDLTYSHFVSVLLRTPQKCYLWSFAGLKSEHCLSLGSWVSRQLGLMELAENSSLG